MTRAPSLEELRLAYVQKIEDALAAGNAVRDAMPSRPNSISITELETAKMWAERDTRGV